MHDNRGPAAVTVTSTDLPMVDTDLLVIPGFEDERVSGGHRLDEATGGELARACAAGEFKGKAYEFFLTKAIAPGWRARRIALAGAGRRQDFDTARARNVAAAVAISARERHVERVAFVPEPAAGDPFLPAASNEAVRWVQAIAEGLVLGEYVGGRYKTSERPRPTVIEAAIVVPGVPPGVLDKLSSAAGRGRTLAKCANLARGLADEPGGILTPRAFAARAADLVGDAGVSAEILDEAAMSAMGMGLLLGVARGSHEPPRLLVIRHEPAGAPPAPVLGLVGKGITFDAGGISIKPALGMERMKDDMSGGAAVVCAMRAIGMLSAPIRVVGIVPCAENMPGGGAIRPGDVLTGASGKTVEVIDTDAEGRLILADALWYAGRQGVTHLVDVATLTGACQIALGKATSGLMGRPAAWVQHVRDVADRSGDRSWILPLFEDYRDQLRSEIADIANVGGRPAGAITAAMFLREFVGELQWAHMDIAGTAWHDEARPFAPKGPSGVAVRTLAELAFTRF
jgi:leucyl aminopeptidase